MSIDNMTKKELVEYGESIGLSLNIRDKKEVLISKFTCPGCSTKFSKEYWPYGSWLWPNSMTDLDTRIYDESVMLCALCHRGWGGNLPTGKKLEVNPSTGKLRYVPINSSTKHKASFIKRLLRLNQER